MLIHNPTAKCIAGETYECAVPDTLDLADRMSMAINALTNVWYPEEKWAMGFVVDFSRRPAVRFSHHIVDSYLNIPPKMIEALVLCRLASGNSDNLDRDHGAVQAQIGFIGEDGLTYCPSDILTSAPGPRGFSEIWGEGRTLLALSMLAQVDDDPRWIAIGRRKVDRLLSLTREKEGFRFFWKGRFWPGETVPLDVDEPSRPIKDGSGSLADFYNPVFSMMYSVGALGHGAGLFYRVAGYEPALELSKGLAKWALARMFKNEDGRYEFGHFHHGLYALIAVGEYAYAANDREALERVDACYRWARAMGDPLIGFYPEVMPGSEVYLRRQGNTVETCEVADMVLLALYLTRAGLDDYWDDVDRWVRNVYAEAQLRDITFLERVPDHYFNSEPIAEPRLLQDVHSIPERSRGAFLGYMRANDGLMVETTAQGPRLFNLSLGHCCTGNGSRTLFYVWDSIVASEGNEVRVNLLLNRASPWLDVDSYLPVEGKVVLHIKDTARVAVRIPEWCDPLHVHVTVGDQPRRALIQGRFLRVGWLKPGDQVILTFPMPERVVHRVIGEVPYKLVLRGSNVVSIDPKGAVYPLYEDQPTGKLFRKARFVPRIRHIIW